MTLLDRQPLLILCHEQGIPIDFLDEVDSTNRYLGAAQGSSLRICIADSQTDGKGQRGRHWHSPPGENIYFSCRYPFHGTSTTLSGLSLAVSVTTHAILQSLIPDIPLMIKWPNDILCHQQKMAGILIELKPTPDEIIAIIGIGINVNMMPEDTHPIDQPWISLRQVTGQYIDRHPIYATLINHLPDCLARFQEQGLAPFLEPWRKADSLINQSIQVQQGKQWLRGKARGVDSEGRLLIETEEGHQLALASGEASVRPCF